MESSACRASGGIARVGPTGKGIRVSVMDEIIDRAVPERRAVELHLLVSFGDGAAHGRSTRGQQAGQQHHAGGWNLHGGHWAANPRAAEADLGPTRIMYAMELLEDAARRAITFLKSLDSRPVRAGPARSGATRRPAGSRSPTAHARSRSARATRRVLGSPATMAIGRAAVLRLRDRRYVAGRGGGQLAGDGLGPKHRL